MTSYQSKYKKITGTNLKEVSENAWIIYKEIVFKTKRQPYIRSAYFKKDKIFFNFFWDHLYQKSPKEKFQRLKYFKAAIDLIKNSNNKPISKQNPNKPKEILHRFIGKTKDGYLFCVQIKENKKSRKKFFISCFHWDQKE